MRVRNAALVAWLFLIPAVLFSQTSRTINGEVKDSSGALVAGASLTLTDAATNATRVETSNNDGLFAFPSLPPGRYVLAVQMKGFKSETEPNIDLQVQQTLRADFALQPGQVNESVEVSAAAEQLSTDNATVGNRYREQASCGTASQRARLPATGAIKSKRYGQLRLNAELQPARRNARERELFHFRPALYLQPLHAGWHRKYRCEFQFSI